MAETEAPSLSEPGLKAAEGGRAKDDMAEREWVNSQSWGMTTH